MLKFKTSCAVLAYLSSNLLNEVGLFLFRYSEVDLSVCDIVVKMFTFAISPPDEFLLPFIFAVLLLRYNFKCLFKRFLNFEKGHVGIAEIWRFLNVKITAVAMLDF